jgi:hypothetical protein
MGRPRVRCEAMLEWREAEGIDGVLANDEWVTAEKVSVFERAMPCGPIGHDAHGHAVVLETPGTSTALLNQLFEAMDCDDFLRLQVYNKQVLRRITWRPCRLLRRRGSTMSSTSST